MKRIKLSKDNIRTIQIFAVSVCTTAVLIFSVLALQSANILESATINNSVQLSVFLFFAFAFLGLSKFVSYFTAKTKIEKIRPIVLLIYDVGVGFVVVFGYLNSLLYGLGAGLFAISIVVSRVLKLFSKDRKILLVFNIIGIVFGSLLSLVFFASMFEGVNETALVLVNLILMFNALFEIAFLTFKGLKLRALYKIAKKTYAIEILFGLLTLMVAFSMIFYLIEPNFNSFADGLWYSFAVVTTIGFGDLAATTGLGRVLSVLLGIFGLIAVAVITSIIVNFYNEVKDKRDSNLDSPKEEVVEEIPQKEEVAEEPAKEPIKEDNIDKE